MRETGAEGTTGRREFLRSLGRGALAAGLLAGVWSLLSRGADGCVVAATCAGCPRLEGCAQPQATRERRVAGVSAHGR